MRILLVSKKSTFSQMGEDVRTAHLLQSASLEKAREVHARHQAAFVEIRDFLEKAGALAYVIEGFYEPLQTEGVDLVVTLGGDGTLLSASHHVGKGLPVFGINSDPSTSVGHFCRATASDAKEALADILRGSGKTTEVARLRVTLGGRLIHQRILNDILFSHSCPAATSKFTLQWEGSPAEDHACSGLWVSTAAGSTGAMLSAGGIVLSFESSHLQALVREPILNRPGTPPSRYHKVSQTFEVTSKMMNAVIHMDGPWLKAEVGYGDVLTLDVSPEPLTILG